MFLLSSRLDTGSLGHQINNWKIIFLLPHKIDSLQNDVSLLDSPPRDQNCCTENWVRITEKLISSLGGDISSLGSGCSNHCNHLIRISRYQQFATNSIHRYHRPFNNDQYLLTWRAEGPAKKDSIFSSRYCWLTSRGRGEIINIAFC